MDLTKIAIDVFDRRANEYHEKFMDVSLYSDSFDLFCSKIVIQNANILEIACGPGNITNYLLNKRPDFKILGIDLAPKMIDIAKANNPAAEFKLMDCRTINSFENRFDGIMCGFCLPYLSREESIQLIVDSSKLVKDNGVLCLSTMEDEYDKSGFETSSYGDRIFIHYHQADYLTKAIEENQFEIIDLQRKKYQALDGKLITDLLFIALKNGN